MKEGSIKIALRFSCDNCKAIIYTLKSVNPAGKRRDLRFFFGSFLSFFNDCLNRAEWMQVIRTIPHLFHDSVQPTEDAGGEELLSGFRSPPAHAVVCRVRPY